MNRTRDILRIAPLSARLGVRPATVIATAALVFAAGGGAYAETTVSSQTVAGWAVVSAQGHLARGSGAINSFILKNTKGKSFPGDYQVTFTTDVSACSYQASLGNPGSGRPPVGDVGVARRTGNRDAVYVRTVNVKGFGANEGFYLEVIC
jgi:hypothetical protein